MSGSGAVVGSIMDESKKKVVKFGGEVPDERWLRS